MDVHGSLDTTVNRISFDSRTVDSESIFVAIAGTQTDGHKFIDKAIENGAQAVVLERMPEELREKCYVRSGAGYRSSSGHDEQYPIRRAFKKNSNSWVSPVPMARLP
jgi:UDP-N-acetylmuramyl pentapeptide synthase